VAEHFGSDLNTLFNSEERALVLAGGHTNHDVIEKVGGSPDQVFMASGQGVEGAGVNSCDHGASA